MKSDYTFQGSVLIEQKNNYCYAYYTSINSYCMLYADMNHTMLPSYPNYEWVDELSIQFWVPGRLIVNKITKDSKDKVLRRRTAGKFLLGRLETIAALLSRHRICIKYMSSRQLEVIMFLPPPPCPAPKAICLPLKRHHRGPLLAKSDENHIKLEWITLFDYMTEIETYKRLYGLIVLTLSPSR